MPQFRLSHLAIAAAFVGLNVATTLIPGASTAYAAEAVKDAVGKPLKEAQADVKSGKYKEALAKIHEAESASSHSAYETYLIEFTRAGAAQGAHDYGTMAKAYEAVLATGQASPAQSKQIAGSLGGLYVNLGEYPKAILWLTRAQGEGDGSVRPALIDAYYRSGDKARAFKEVSADIQAEEKAGRSPSTEQLQMLLTCAKDMSDKNVYLSALEKNAAYHPSKEIWASLLNRLASKPGFSSRLEVDTLRLRLQLGTITTDQDYMNLIQSTMNAGFPAESKRIIDVAYKTGVFGTGAEAARQKRMQDAITKGLADDAKAMPKTEADATKNNDDNVLAVVGYDYVTLGQFDKGIAMIERAIASGNLKHPDDEKIHLAQAYLLAGKKAQALKTLKGVQGSDGTADLARYWTMAINHPLS